LSKGFETLAASGFYEWNGDGPITEARVREYLGPARVRRILTATLDLLNSAIADLERARDHVLLINALWAKMKIVQLFSTKLHGPAVNKQAG